MGFFSSLFSAADGSRGIMHGQQCSTELYPSAGVPHGACMLLGFGVDTSK